MTHIHGWETITPTHHTDATTFNLLKAADIFWNEANELINETIETEDFTSEEMQARITALQEQAEILQGIAKGTIEFVIVKRKNPNQDFIDPVNANYDAWVEAGWILEDE